MDIPEDLDALARRADEDRWLAARFIGEPQARADVEVIYALDQELAHAPRAVREPMMGEIRLTWWREGIEGLFAGGGARGHPTLTALANVIARRRLALEPLLAMVDARFDDIGEAPFADLAAVQAYADGVSGAPMALAVAILGQGEAAGLRPAALAWTLARLTVGGGARLAQAPDAKALGLKALAEARAAIAALPVAAFPAVAHLCLAGPCLKGRKPGDLETRARLLAASLTGKV